MRNKNIELFAVSFVMLFMEIFLIRWISTEVRIFAYFSNLALLACFLGIGVGCYFSNEKTNIFITIGMLVAVALAAQSAPFLKISDMLTGFSDSVVWYSTFEAKNFMPALQGTILTISMFLMMVAAFIPLGQILGKILDEYGNIIVGYSVNVLASLIGIWVFNLFSFFSTPPWLWFLFAMVILLLFIPRDKLHLSIAGAALILIMLITAAPHDSLLTVWSPYQKLDLYNKQFSGVQNGYVLNVNNVGYMTLLDQSDDFVKRFQGLYGSEVQKYNQYVVPYQFTDSKSSALLIGAGAGNDAAGALRSGIERIDAVEIDPGIYKVGLKWHPEKPYENWKVNVIIDDARAFLKKSKYTYDVISFGVLDSHRLSSNFNNMRLDDYIYTEGSLREAKKLLKEDGVLTLTFLVDQRQWIGDRIYGLLGKVFGEVPYTFVVYDSYLNLGGVMFVTSKNLEKLKKHVESQPDLVNRINKTRVIFPCMTKLTTDDWPYLYIQKPSIPRLYVLVITAILALMFIMKRFLMGSQSRKLDLHFFFLGCAFLLLEFQNISKANLLFGSTWIVNSYIISSILLLILLANVFVYYIKAKSVNIFYALLLASVIMIYIIPLSAFNNFGYWTKSLLVAGLLNLPILFAGMIFIKSFEKAPLKDVALGSNLIGGVIGGLLETLSFVTGVKALLILVFVLYSASYVCLKRSAWRI